MQKFSRYILGLLLIGVLLLGSIIVQAHEDDEPPEPGDEDHVHIEDFEFDEPLTYYQHIQPIIATNCMGCHEAGQIAGDVILDDPLVLQESADYVADLVAMRYMPPWMPDVHDTVPLRNPRTLTDEEIATFVAWAQNGAEIGDSTDASNEIVRFELPDVRQDYVFEMEAPYLPDDTNNDDYRCFIADPGLEEPAFVTGFVFEPDQTEQVHHGIIYKVSGDVRNRAALFDGQDGQPGWSCYNDTRLGGRHEEMLGTWTPGTFADQFPENTGYLMEPGDFLVMQVHYWVGGQREPDATGFYLELADADADIQPLMTFQLLAPVEIPCPEGVEGKQCDRDFAVQYAAERYGSEFARRPDELLRGCRLSLDDYADLDPANAVSSCEFPVWGEVTAVGVFGHMHELGKSIRIELNPDSEDNVVLLDIPAWDFHWQDRYQFAEPIVTKPGDVLRMTCVWDNTLSEDPRYIVWGEGTQDEMCFSTIMVIEP